VEQPLKSPTSKLESRFASAALKYFKSLDKTTQRRIKDKIAELELDPQNIRTSKPLQGAQKRSARVGSYRILFLIEGNILLVSDIGPRGQVYRNV
jgi:mRNA interferase RelE/StbE